MKLPRTAEVGEWQREAMQPGNILPSSLWEAMGACVDSSELPEEWVDAVRAPPETEGTAAAVQRLVDLAFAHADRTAEAECPGHRWPNVEEQPRWHAYRGERWQVPLWQTWWPGAAEAYTWYNKKWHDGKEEEFRWTEGDEGRE